MENCLTGRCENLDFTSINFLYYFLPLFLIIYRIAPHKSKNAVLLIGSAVFYYLGEREFLAVLPVSIGFNYIVGRMLEKNREKTLLATAVAGNLAIMAVFKLWVGVIPLGLSFFTFQAISYLADIYEKEIVAEGNLGRFALFMGMFPKISSGPIVTYRQMESELHKREKITGEKFQKGLQWFILGLAAKVLLADRLQVLWHEVEVAGYESITWRYAWIGAVAYSLKLYFDFYGYSLMAIGLGKMLGFTLPDNFRTPYLAGSVRDFYRRWHITLGLWFRKYVYIPLGGSRRGSTRTILNLLAVWILTGLWHGFSINFILWGLFLWCLLLLERLTGRIADKMTFLRRMKVLPHMYLLFVIPISWMFFAIGDLTQLQVYLNRMFGIGEVLNGNVFDWWIAVQRHGGILAAAAVCASGLIEWIREKKEKSVIWNLLLALLFWICVWKLLRQGSNPFQYAGF